MLSAVILTAITNEVVGLMKIAVDSSGFSDKKCAT